MSTFTTAPDGSKWIFLPAALAEMSRAGQLSGTALTDFIIRATYVSTAERNNQQSYFVGNGGKTIDVRRATGQVLVFKRNAFTLVSGPDEEIEAPPPASEETNVITDAVSNQVDGTGREDDLGLTSAESADDGDINASTNDDRTRANLGSIDYEPVTPRDNPLHAFPSASYTLGLYALPAEDYNNTMRQFDWSPARDSLLINSAGKTAGRNRHFQKEYAIDDLMFTGLVGTGGISRNSNVYDLEFTVIEPDGCSFIESLINVAMDHNIPYIDMPYMLTIEFQGYDTDGIERKLSNITKFIPIKIVQVSMSISSQGSKYAVQAVPYAVTGFDVLRGSLPFNVAIKGGTVEDFFAGTMKLNPASEEVDDDANDRETIGAGLAEALNKHNEALRQSGGYEHADVYSFSIDPSIGRTEIDTRLFDNESPNEAVAVDTAEGSRQVQSGELGASAKVRTFDIPYGSLISSTVEDVVKRSKFVLNQVDDLTADDKDLSTSLRFFRITPRIELKEYDAKRRCMAKDIVYNIDPYLCNGRIFPGSNTPPTVPYHKVYHYTYTGQNKDIENFEIDLDSTYYEAYSLISDRSGNLYSPNFDADEPVSGIDPARTIDASHASKSTVTSGNTADPDSDSTRRASAQQITEQLLSKTVGMIELKLDIIGDPDYIPQADLYGAAVATKDRLASAYTRNGSINYIGRETYVRFNLSTPVSINPGTGEPNGGAQRSVFVSGSYRIYAVESRFSGGRFTQTIRGIRIVDAEDAARNKRPTSASQAVTAEPADPLNFDGF